MQRIFDIIFSFLALVLLAPFLLPVMVILRLTGEGEVFYIQQRAGYKDNEFGLLKFATMLKDSPRIGTGEITVKGDPRVLPFGKLLRKTKLNELPQLWNVVKGEMSLVGPRPLFEEDNEYFDKNYMRRLNVLPGMTGLLQINERNTDDFSVWYKYDIEYIENWNLYLDIKILLKTFNALKRDNTSGK